MAATLLRGILPTVLFLGLCAPGLSVEPAGEIVRFLCDPTNPEEWARCTDDSLRVVFDETARSSLEYETFEQDRLISMTVILDVRSPGVRGWSFGVAHDPEILSLESVRIDPALSPYLDLQPCLLACVGCCPRDLWVNRDVTTCGSDPECAPSGRTPGGGWTSAVVFQPTREGVELPPGSIPIARASYRLHRDVGGEGTAIWISDRLVTFDGRVPTSDVLTVGGASRIWATVADGWIRKRPPADFKRGDSNADGQFDLSDPLATLEYHFLGGPQPSDCLRAADADDDGTITLTDAIYSLVCLFLSPQVPAPPWEACGSDTTPDELTCRSFPPCS